MDMRSVTRTFGAALLLLLMLCLAVGCSAEDKPGAKAAPATKFPAFQTVDLQGNAVSQDIFKSKKVTVINIWGTFCPPCVEEMPELGKWAKEMPENAQIIGIVCDAENEKDEKIAADAVKILTKADASFLNLMPSKEIFGYLEEVTAVPTTIFVDAEGNILGSPVVGANVPAYKKRLEEYLK